MVVKISRLGLITARIKGKNAYLRDRWCRFETTMVLFLFISVVLHVVQIIGFQSASSREVTKKFVWFGIARSPRPLIFVRIFRLLLTIKLPTARISQILKRSSQQIYNVTLFFLFFMSFYGILGVQFFGALKYHCVLKETNTSEITVDDLAIPDAPCSPREYSDYGYKCPVNMKCVEIKDDPSVTGYSTFSNFLISFFSVYNAASQEGWSNVMYQTIDTLDPWKSGIYFVTLIFFLAWLVKNVFIAVIIETFAEIRVQFQQMWGSPETTSETTSMVLESEDDNWKLVSLDERKPHALAPQYLQQLVKSPYFNTVFMVLIFFDAVIAATRNSKTERDPKAGKAPLDLLYYVQVAFTAVFVVEVLLKLWVFGPRAYFRPMRHKWEFVLAFFSTLNVIPECYRGIFTYAQVLRIFRLIKASPVLEEFCWKIFGPTKKLGSLILFTMALLIITSGISLQLFCYIKVDENTYHQQFSTFPQALQSTFQILCGENWSQEMYTLMTLVSFKSPDNSDMVASILIAGYFVIIHLIMTSALSSMFQILMKKSWTDIMHQTMVKARLTAGTAATAFVAIYFISFHLLVTVIILSLFVAVILDNLDLDEDIKKLKQLKAREMSTAQQQNLPLRLRVFEKFSNQPQLVSVSKKLTTIFTAPKVRESFMRSFVDSGSSDSTSSGVRHRKPKVEMPHSELSDISLLTGKPASLSTRDDFRRDEISGLIFDSSEQRTMNSSDPLISKGNATLPANKSLLSANQGNSSSTLRALMSRAIVPFEETSINAMAGVGKARSNTHLRNPRTLLESSGSKPQRNGGVSGTLPSQNSTTAPLAARSNTGDDIDIQILQQKKQQAEIKRNQQESELRENHPYFDTPLFMVGRESKFRNFCRMIVTARYSHSRIDSVTGQESKVKYKKLAKFLSIVPVLDWIMIFVTILSCGEMFLETPYNRITDFQHTPMHIFMRVTEYLFVLAMSAEMALKIFANGLLFTPNALIRDFSGGMDMFIYFTSLLFLCTMVIVKSESGNIGYLSGGHVLLILRCMRPLRIFILVPHIRKVVYELVRGFKEIILVTIFLIMLMFVFASYGVQRYGGILYGCNDPQFREDKENCTGRFFRRVKVTDMQLSGGENVGYMVPRVWTNPYSFNFDNIINAMRALFEVLSLEGWLEIRDTLIERVGSAEWIFIHVFVFNGVLIGLTLFVGVVISNYSQNKGTALLTVDQRRWLDLKGRVNLTQPLHVPPKPEHNKIRAFMFDVTQHRFFKRTVAVMVALNACLLVVPWHTNIPTGEPLPPTTAPMQYVAVGFVFLFLIEVTMKLIALSPKGYWYSRRNRIDLLITAAGVIWAVLHFSLQKPEPSSPDYSKLQSNREGVDTVGYIVIILRFITITGKHATLKMLMLTVAESMWKSCFLIIGMFLLMLFYAYSGVLVFGMVRYGENLNRHANFRTAGNAIGLLFRIVTGEDWNKIMRDCMITKPNCYPGDNYWETDCGHAPLSFFYFGTFYVIITYIMLNLLVAIIMENFSLFYSNEEDALLSYNDIRMYQNTWNDVDLARKGSIPNSKVPDLLQQLTGRLKMDIRSVPTKMLFKYLCYEIQYLHGGESGEATFHDVLLMLSYRSVDIRKSLQLEEFLVREDLEMTIAEDVAKKLISDWMTRCVKRMRMHGRSVSKRSTQETYYIVTEADELPLADPVAIEVTPDSEHLPGPSKKSVTRNVSEPIIGLQVPRKVTTTLSDSQAKERLKKNSLCTRTEFSEGMDETVSTEKSSNVDTWWGEQFTM
ncbi:sodium leak channel NALCN-like [Watersipora subatra]|uniref:sodium leak channel NALCN-like n=1 Tax=Watersipora subatra TaxID=2589382 RepID=UPI00355BA845